MTIDQLIYLKNIIELGSINAAANHLFRAKSAISYSIKSLEKECGFLILDRSGYRIKLTKKGEMFYEKSLKLLEYNNELKTFTNQIASNIESKISISSTVLYPQSLATKILKKLIKDYPSTEVIFQRETLSGEKLLLDKMVDIAIFEDVKDTANIESKEILQVNMPLLISANHPFLHISKSEQTLKNLVKYPQILVGSTLPDEKNTGGVYKDAKKWKVTELSTKKDLIKEGLGWGRLPEYAVEKELENKTLVQLDHIEKKLKVKIYIARRKGEAQGKVAFDIWEMFK